MMQIAASAPFGWVSNTALVWRGSGDVVITTTTQATDDRSGLAASLGALSDVYVETMTSTWPAMSFDRALQQFDRSGNLGVTSVRVANDLTPPALAVAGTTRTTNGTATLNVSVSDMQSDVRGVDVAIVQDGITRTVLATNTLATSVTANGLAFGSVYVWEVTARDNVNNVTSARFTVVSARATKTYYFGSMRVAVRDTNVLSYLHSDHLSSVSASTDVNGKLIGVQLFAPYGEQRAEWGNVDGSWGWATHRKAESNGLTFMRARWYLAGISRFAQPDSAIPDVAKTQAWNRYALNFNNPLRFIDPTGFDPLDAQWESDFKRSHGRKPNDEDRRDRLFSLIFKGSGKGGEWTKSDWGRYQSNKLDYWSGKTPWDKSAQTGVDSFVSHVDTLATHYKPGEEDQFVSAMGLVWGGIPYSTDKVTAAYASLRGPITHPCLKAMPTGFQD